MAVTGTAYQTTTGDKFLPEEWDAIDVLAYEEAVFYNKITEHKRLYKKLHIPLHANLSRNTLSAGSDGTGVTYSANTESEVTLSPGTTYIAVNTSIQMLDRMKEDPQDMFKRSMEMSIVEGIDSSVFSLVSALTTNTVGSGATQVSKSDITAAVQKLAAGAKMYFKPGQTDGIGILHVNQVNDFLSISDITNAQMRGGSETPITTGWIAKAFGVRWYESGNVNTSGGTAYNVVFIPRAFAISFNQKPKVRRQDFELAHRIYIHSDFGYGTVRDQYAVKLETASAA